MEQGLKRKILYRIFFAGTFVIALVGIFLPGQLLIVQRESEMDQVAAAPPEYYSAASSAMARNVSANLKTYEKLQLISGKWESELSEAAVYETELPDYEAVTAAREGIEVLFQNGIYPSSVSTDYGNWYAWEAKPYRATDTIFHTYSAYYWKIVLTKYDGSERHTIFLLDDGTVFLSMAEYDTGFSPDSLTDAADYLKTLEGNEVQKKETASEKPENWISYTDVDMAGLQWKSLTQVTRDEEVSYVLQAYSDDRYLYAVTP